MCVCVCVCDQLVCTIYDHSEIRPLLFEMSCVYNELSGINTQWNESLCTICTWRPFHGEATKFKKLENMYLLNGVPSMEQPQNSENLKICNYRTASPPWTNNAVKCLKNMYLMKYVRFKDAICVRVEKMYLLNGGRQPVSIKWRETTRIY